MDRSVAMDNPAAADVLIEARRNLQQLIDSGVPRQLLHQLVEESEPKCSDDAATRAFLYGPQPPFARHQPRVSISSTCSGSSGHASLWSISTNSSNSSAASSQSSPSPSSQAVAWPSAAGPHHSGNTTPTSAPVTSPQEAVSMAMAVAAPKTTSPVAPTSTTTKANLYCCTSCETTFKRKYDWKRHEDEFHERWKKYPCPEPGCNRSFWGANTFNQHHKQSHGCKTCPHSEKVVKYLRKRKYWACGFCSALHPSRERHVEHVARDFESGKTKAEWMHSRVIYGLLHQPMIHEAWKALLQTKQAEYAARTPNFSWDPSKTGRAQGFLENEGPGQLQDHLEFFSGTDVDAQVLVQAAYEMADVMFMTSPFGSPGQEHQQLNQPPQEGVTATSPFSDMSTPTQQQQQQQQFAQPSMAPPTCPPPAPPPQSMLMSQDAQGAFPPSFRHTQMMSQPMFAQTAHPKSYSTPLRRSSLERDLPPPPPPEHLLESPIPQQPHQSSFTFLPHPVVMDDWQSFATTVVDDGSQHSVASAQGGVNSSAAAAAAAAAAGQTADWPMVDYFDPSQGQAQ